MHGDRGDDFHRETVPRACVVQVRLCPLLAHPSLPSHSSLPAHPLPPSHLRPHTCIFVRITRIARPLSHAHVHVHVLLALLACCRACAVLAMLTTRACRAHQASQPIFLVVFACGAMLLSSTIILLSVDEICDESACHDIFASWAAALARKAAIPRFPIQSLFSSPYFSAPA